MEQETTTMPYADYEWYTNEYGGSVLTEEDFPRNARFATRYIDAITFGNIKSEEQVVDCVKDCMCAVAELAKNYYDSTIAAEEGRGKKSESNDGYSVTFDETLSTAESFYDECRAACRLYLINTGLLFRGTKRPRRCRP